MTNLYPGTCKCGKWVAKGAGQAIAPASRIDRWGVGCFQCMTPSEQTDSGRKAEHMLQAQRQCAARIA